MSRLQTDLAALGAGIEWPDAEPSALARAADPGTNGRLANLVEWLAATQGRFPPHQPSRPRCIVVGEIGSPVRELAATLDVGVHELNIGDGVSAALAAGTGAADEEIESGSDLLVVAGPDSTVADAALVCVLTGAEPVALLPRGIDAVDTSTWIARAGAVRDTRRLVVDLADQPDELLAALDHPALATLAGIILRAASRRTAIVLDGAGALAAALLVHRIDARAAQWCRVADDDTDPVHGRAAREMDQQPLLMLGTSAGDGRAGLLTVPLLRAAVLLSGAPR